MSLFWLVFLFDEHDFSTCTRDVFFFESIFQMSLFFLENSFRKMGCMEFFYFLVREMHSLKLTYLPFKGSFEDDFPFPKVGYVNSLEVPSLKLTWHLKMMVSNRNLLFQRSIFRCYVSFRECISFLKKRPTAIIPSLQKRPSSHVPALRT